ncbi:MAG: hypothetical protein J3K34DRAFT_129186 [Monoraphidium minutum]|nr:MAG: hypothetical protein J3K34DRAFT_129186 [Monoraphidium minutum]
MNVGHSQAAKHFERRALVHCAPPIRAARGQRTAAGCGRWRCAAARVCMFLVLGGGGAAAFGAGARRAAPPPPRGCKSVQHAERRVRREAGCGPPEARRPRGERAPAGARVRGRGGESGAARGVQRGAPARRGPMKGWGVCSEACRAAEAARGRRAAAGRRRRRRGACICWAGRMP